MTSLRATAVGLGIAFGFVLTWSGMTDPDLIRGMLLLEDPYFFLVMLSSMSVAFPGVRVLRARRSRALLTGEPLVWTPVRAAPRHVTGSVLFGAGWATSLSCPGPIAAQLGQGQAWSLCTILGVAAGLVLHGRLTVRGPAQLRRSPPGGSSAARATAGAP
ncbi:MAG: DUF6691 family protein [Gaiellaceae bacterium]